MNGICIVLAVIRIGWRDPSDRNTQLVRKLTCATRLNSKQVNKIKLMGNVGMLSLQT